jgi:hypothetical protein
MAGDTHCSSALEADEAGNEGARTEEGMTAIPTAVAGKVAVKRDTIPMKVNASFIR